jgi:hypothetical protein
MADNHIRLRGGFGCSLRGDKTRHHACKCDRVSRNERDNALSQWLLRERHAHNPALDPSSITNIITAKKFRRQPKSLFGAARPRASPILHRSGNLGLALRTHHVSACPYASCRHDPHSLRRRFLQ